MGLLTVGKPLKWEDAAKAREYVKEHGVDQFINNFKHNKEAFQGTEFMWGDEIEYMIIHAPDEEGKRHMARLSLRSHEVIEAIEKQQKDLHEQEQALELKNQHSSELPDNRANEVVIHPEYGSFMIEGTPATPYGNLTKDLRRVEQNMRDRRAYFEKFLRNEELLVTMGCFPRMGAGQHTHPPTNPNGNVAQSIYVSDDIINIHPRFATLTRSIRKRRGKKVDIRVPIFRDVNTENNSDIHMDAMAFGMGCTCLQVTFQAKHVDEARHLHDQLAILTPIMMALSACTPFHKGQVSDWDVRWSIISQSVDDRIPAERGFFSPSDLGGIQPGQLLDGLFEGSTGCREWCPCKVISVNNPQVVVEKIPSGERVKIPRPDLYTRTQPYGTRCNTNNKVKRLAKSRYDSISMFLMNSLPWKPEYNDIPCPIDEAAYKKLVAAGIDHTMATHVAHLFVREPLVIYKERLENLDDKKSSEHFENIQSTNWQNVRFKPPPENGTTGWRVEFRTLEAQITDFENAAFVVFVALLSRAILFFDLDMYMPLSKVDENMSTAHRRDAVLKERFWFRKDMNCGSHTNSLGSMTVRDIICGNDYRTGLTDVVRSYLDEINCDQVGKDLVGQYLDLIEKRAKGELPTGARWQRNFVTNHPLYEKDSLISEELTRKLVEEAYKVAHGDTSAKTAKDLLGKRYLRAKEWEGVSRKLWSSTPSSTNPQMSANRTYWRWKHRPNYNAGQDTARQVPFTTPISPNESSFEFPVAECSPDVELKEPPKFQIGATLNGTTNRKERTASISPPSTHKKQSSHSPEPNIKANLGKSVLDGAGPKGSIFSVLNEPSANRPVE